MLIYVTEGSRYQILATMDMVSGNVEARKYSAEYLRSSKTVVLDGTREIPLEDFIRRDKDITLYPLLRN